MVTHALLAQLCPAWPEIARFHHGEEKAKNKTHLLQNKFMHYILDRNLCMAQLECGADPLS
jgi:hypothetical protein